MTSLRIVVTGAILAYLASQIDMPRAIAATLRVDARALLVVLALVACDRGVMILRWLLLLRGAGVSVGAATAARIYLISAFVGSFLPAGLGGDMARAYGMSRAAADPPEAIASVAIDRLLGIVALLAMGSIGLALWVRREATWPALLAGLLLLAGSLAAFWADTLVARMMPVRWQTSRLGRDLVAFIQAISRYRARPRTILHVFTWSLAVQLLRIVQAFVLGLGLGLTVPFSYYLLFMPVGLLMLLLPISISGFGVPQGVIVWLLQPVGVPQEHAFALSTLIVVTGLAGNLPGLVLWLRWRAPRS
jgi:uncharacterized protein (TIRG00374 family)